MINKNYDMHKVSGGTEIAEVIRKYIIHKDLHPGDRLPTHAELCGILALGPRRLREGLSILEREGLLVTCGRGGTVVADPTLDCLEAPIARHLDHHGCSKEDLVVARARLESAIVVEACQRRTARDLLTLLDTIEQMEKLCDAQMGDEEVDERFHLAVLQASHNPALEILGQLISTQFTRKLQDELLGNLVRQQESLAEHRQLFGAIEQRDDVLAAKLMYDHIVVQTRKR